MSRGQRLVAKNTTAATVALRKSYFLRRKPALRAQSASSAEAVLSRAPNHRRHGFFWKSTKQQNCWCHALCMSTCSWFTARSARRVCSVGQVVITAKAGAGNVYSLRRHTPPREDLGLCVLPHPNVQNGDTVEHRERAWIVERVSAHYALRKGRYRKVETRLHVVETGRWLVNQYLEQLLEIDETSR